MSKFFGIYTWITKKGQAGKKFVKLTVKGNIITRVFEDKPFQDIKHITFLIFGKCFTLDCVWNRKVLDY